MTLNFNFTDIKNIQKKFSFKIRMKISRFMFLKNLFINSGIRWLFETDLLCAGKGQNVFVQNEATHTKQFSDTCLNESAYMS